MFDDDVWRYLPLGPLPTLVLGALGLAAAIHLALVRSRTNRAIALALLVASVLVVLAYTGRGALTNPNGDFSWHVGDSIHNELRNINRSLGLVNVFGNVALFVPIGWLVAVLCTRRRLVIGTAAAFGLSTLVEVWQMLSGSFGDIDDVILNSLGGLLGAAAAAAVILVGCRRDRAEFSR